MKCNSPAVKQTILFENTLIKVVVENSEVPWLIVFTQRSVKEFSECSQQEKSEIFRVLDIIEKDMLAYFNADKINIASFGNMLPQVHWHIMARFEQDSYFPEPMWGDKQRDAKLNLPSLEAFYQQINSKL